MRKPFILKYCLDRYKTQEMYHKAVDVFLTTLKFVPDWFVTNKMLEKLGDVVFSKDDIVFVYENSDNVTFFSDDVGLNYINLDDDTSLREVVTFW